MYYVEERELQVLSAKSLVDVDSIQLFQYIDEQKKFGFSLKFLEFLKVFVKYFESKQDKSSDSLYGGPNPVNEKELLHLLESLNDELSSEKKYYSESLHTTDILTSPPSKRKLKDDEYNIWNKMMRLKEMLISNQSYHAVHQIICVSDMLLYFYIDFDSIRSVFQLTKSKKSDLADTIYYWNDVKKKTMCKKIGYFFWI